MAPAEPRAADRAIGAGLHAIPAKARALATGLRAAPPRAHARAGLHAIPAKARALATGLRAAPPRAHARATRLLAPISVRAFVLVASVAVAYNYSLATLLSGLTLQTPVAYLALVPLISLLLGAVNFRLQPNLRPIHDRQLDWIIGLIFIGAAASVDLLLPSAYTADFWLHRLDMIGLPFFAAGMICIMFGTRRLWALRWAVLFLFLAWPDPYVTILASAIGTSTDVALSAVQASLAVIPVAQPLGNGTFLIAHGGGQFSLAVGSACSGINSLVGFVILGAAFNTILKGGAFRRILWLATGLLLVGTLNVVRIDLIFVAGWAFGESFAIDVLHPVAGVVVFGVGALAMLGLASIFGLRVPEPSRPGLDVKRPAPASRPVPAPPRFAVSITAPMAVGLMFAVLLAMPDASFARYNSLLDAFGSPTLGAVDPNGLTITGWQAAKSTSFGQATSYFGPHATWERVPFSSTVIGASATSTVYLDVIRTDDAGSLATYGVAACYNFHGYTQVWERAVDVGAGVQAKVASYRSPNAGTDWSILWWDWPYNAGGQTRFERLVLLAPLDPADHPEGSTPKSSFDAAELNLESMAGSIVAAGINDQVQLSDTVTQP